MDAYLDNTSPPLGRQCWHEEAGMLPLRQRLHRSSNMAHATRTTIHVLDVASVRGHLYIQYCYKILHFRYIFLRPPLVGACPHCNVVGVRCANTMVFTSALAGVPRASPAREMWRNLVTSVDIEEAEKKYGGKGKVFNDHVEEQLIKGLKLMTTREAVASGQRALRATTKAQVLAEPFMAVSVYCTLFPGIPSHYCYLFLLICYSILRFRY